MERKKLRGLLRNTSMIFLAKTKQNHYHRGLLCKQPQLYTICKYVSQAQNTHGNQVKSLVYIHQSLDNGKVTPSSQPQNMPWDATAPPSIWFFILSCLITSHFGFLHTEGLESRDRDSRLHFGFFPLSRTGNSESRSAPHTFQAFVFKEIAFLFNLLRWHPK